MATVNAVIKKSESKNDGTWNVKIRVTHKGPSRYISTEHFVTSKQITKKYIIKDMFIISKTDLILSEYRKEISTLGEVTLNQMTVTELRDHLEALGKNTSDNGNINFIEFAEMHISKLIENDQAGSAGNYRAVKNSLVDFFGTTHVYTKDITVRMLHKFEAYLKTERTQVRPNQLGETTTTVKKGLKESGIHGYMRDLRGLFSAARLHHNDEETGVIKIPNYPFQKYKVGSPPARAKRNMEIWDVIKIRDVEVEPDSRAELARDLFMLSFYLCGMNAVDIYRQPEYKGGRIEYNRAKTEKIRKDNAFISIHVPEEAIPSVEKYFGKIHLRYSSAYGLNKALQKGFIAISELLPEVQAKLPRALGMYFARHTFGNLGRNVCRFSMDDVALAMNHVEDTNRVTDMYVDRDWTIIDEVQAGVIRLIREIDNTA